MEKRITHWEVNRKYDAKKQAAHHVEIEHGGQLGRAFSVMLIKQRRNILKTEYRRQSHQSRNPLPAWMRQQLAPDGLVPGQIDVAGKKLTDLRP